MPDIKKINVGSTDYDISAKKMQYLTTAPTADNTGDLQVVLLTTEPETKYNGYIYIITEPIARTPVFYEWTRVTEYGTGPACRAAKLYMPAENEQTITKVSYKQTNDGLTHSWTDLSVSYLTSIWGSQVGTGAPGTYFLVPDTLFNTDEKYYVFRCCFSNNKWSPTSEVSPQTCLIEGTKITMADGSYKNIEQVKPGDLVKSYNPYTHEFTLAVVMSNINTMVDYKYSNLIFSNGTCVGVDDSLSHEIFNVTKNTFTNVNQNDELALGDIVLNKNVNPINYVGAEFVSDPDYNKHFKFYNLITSNNCYFANDILFAHNPITKYTLNHLYNDNIYDIIYQDKDPNSFNLELANNNDYIKEVAEFRANNLNLSEKEIKEKVFGIRGKYINPAYEGMNEMQIRAELFKEACNRDNENFDLINEEIKKLILN